MPVRIYRYIKHLFVLSVVTASTDSLYGQCSSPVQSFPYNEGFETSTGGWFAGGVNPDWAWGAPSKPVITGAASGNKCWIAGTLSQSSYNNNENSTLTSPCFDFSSLTSPFIRFKVFWETENRYDGAVFQYSLDGGNNWSNLGSYADYVSCPGDNWFNTSAVTALGSYGWSGNVQATSSCTGGAGNGSGGWRLTHHEMASLAGEPEVMFRFRFAAGSICNNYDGFAIDDIWIGEAPAVSSDFTFTCTSNNSISFAANSSSCGASYAWDFGDPSSGASNTSGVSNPTHTFSGPGQYNVTLFVQNGVSPSPVTRQVSIISTVVIEEEPVRCHGNKNGSLLAEVSLAGNYTYQWSTVPQQSTALAAGIGAGTYSVTVSSAQSCPDTAVYVLTEPAAMTHQVTTTDPLCGFPNGIASVSESGGSQPYSYSWTPPIAMGSYSSILPAGNYTVNVYDNNNCSDTATFILNDQNPLKIFLGNDTLICPGQQVVLNPGAFASYRWQDNSPSATYTVKQTGQYEVTVTDNRGCTASDTINVTVDCSDLYFPTAFTPNDDGLNDLFGPFGNVTAVSQYSLRVYDRWGELVFYATSPFDKWDGRVKGKAPGSNLFVWSAQYILPGRGKLLRKGNTLLLR